MSERVILTYGTFDLFHIGHVRLLERARALGDRLVVGLSTDEFNEAKGKKATYSYQDREEILRSVRFVSDVFPERTWEQKVQDIQRIAADVFVMGDDWAGKFDDLSQYCDVVYLSRTPDISSSIVRNSLRIAAA
ncbi:MAG: adenylyltransferase/cytidyltransferase family protein [Devosia sp.]|uniref:adenylyltransferase/cytidyltransferase family protein n=1 Tax=Devosia sp. TaxID=1871048 RepID=UPI0024CD12B0|nr:adenylyltransferase/cytidyltransferase family protein [Devosia sp.]UYO00441.1 MAG: adenylyltransferase/cytidyltransferase family protein [Devosia sp.]